MTPSRLFPSESIRRSIKDHFSQLTAADRRLRFGNNYSDAVVSNYVDSSLDNKRDIWFASRQNNTLIGVLHVAVIDDEQAEFGCSVLSDYRNKGIGTELFTRALIWCKAKGIRKIHLQCLSSNRAMVRMASSLGASVESCDTETLGVCQLPETSFSDIMLDEAYTMIEFYESLINLQLQLQFWGK